MVGPGRPLDSSPALVELLSRELVGLRGHALKSYEDALDGVFCVFLAFHFWRWSWEGSQLIGDLVAGYIVVPTVTLSRNA